MLVLCPVDCRLCSSVACITHRSALCDQARVEMSEDEIGKFQNQVPAHTQ